jgi:hypothetical protein
MTNKRLVHSSPLGALEIPGVLGPVEPGKPFSVDKVIADSLLEQSDLFALAVTAPKKGTAR